jgi:hypothetical protein
MGFNGDITVQSTLIMPRIIRARVWTSWNKLFKCLRKTLILEE